jgi:pimeloyl-ACP methyl ester carboxylesterase
MGDIEMATIVLIHGGWHGGWCWNRVTPILRSNGHRVLTPTLTGLGERAHLAGPDVGMAVHVTDILNVLEYEDLSNVVLVAHSYGGAVATAVAERVPEKIAQLIFVDAFIPRDGQAIVDLVGPGGDRIRAIPGAKIPPFEVERFGVTREQDQKWVSARLVAQPKQTFLDPVQVGNPAAAKLPRAFIYCNQPAMGMFDQFAARAKAESWVYRELAAGHDAMITAPEELARMVLELAEVPTSTALAASSKTART